MEFSKLPDDILRKMESRRYVFDYASRQRMTDECKRTHKELCSRRLSQLHMGNEKMQNDKDRRICRNRACMLEDKYNMFSQENPFNFWDSANECERINAIVSWNTNQLQQAIPVGSWRDCAQYYIEIIILMTSLMQRISIGVAFQTVGFMMENLHDYELEDTPEYDIKSFMDTYEIPPETFVKEKLLDQVVNSYVSLYKKMVFGPLDKLRPYFVNVKVRKGMWNGYQDLGFIFGEWMGSRSESYMYDYVSREKHPDLLTAHLLSAYNTDRPPIITKFINHPWTHTLMYQYRIAKQLVEAHGSEAQRLLLAKAVLVECFPDL